MLVKKQGTSWLPFKLIRLVVVIVVVFASHPMDEKNGRVYFSLPKHTLPTSLTWQKLNEGFLFQP